MVTSHTWHQGTGRVESRLPVPVSLEADELFSTWLVRVAFAQGCDPLVLAALLWPKWRAWTIDLDRGLSIDRLRVLSSISGADVAVLEAASLKAIAMATGATLTSEVAILPWILALGSRNRRRSGGLQYCPICLAADRLPFFRLQWRLAWHTGCPRHGNALLDRCGHCGRPVEPHRLSLSQRILSICSSCGRDLRTCLPGQADGQAMTLQILADDVVKCCYGKYNYTALPSSEWFALSRYFLMLVRAAIRYQPSNLADFLTALGVEIKTIPPAATGLAFELLPVGERAMLLAAVSKLLSTDPRRLMEVACASAMSAATLRQGGQVLPTVMRDIADVLPQHSRLRKSTTKVRESSPISRLGVMRAWARLQRKLGRAL